MNILSAQVLSISSPVSSSHRRLVQLSAGPAGLLEADGAADPATHWAETADGRPGLGQEDGQINPRGGPTDGRGCRCIAIQMDRGAGGRKKNTHTRTYVSMFLCFSLICNTANIQRKCVCVKKKSKGSDSNAPRVCALEALIVGGEKISGEQRRSSLSASSPV